MSEGLSKAISELRSELTKVLEKRPVDGVHFDVKDIELDLQLSYEDGSRAGASAGWSVLGIQFGAKGEINHTVQGVQTVRLKLEPKRVDASNGSINSAPLTISGESPVKR